MTHDLWTTASANVEAEAAERRLAMAKVALSELWPFLAAASDEAEYATRKTIVATEIDAVIEHVAGQGGTAAELRTEVMAALDSDFAVHAEVRAAQALTAALAAEGARFPVTAAPSNVCPKCGAKANATVVGNKLTATCPSCGWKGTKTKKASVTADAHSDGSGAFRVDVRGVGESKWSSNSMSYDTEDEAKAAAQSLYSRWMGMDMARVVPNSTPRGEAVDTSDPKIVIGASKQGARKTAGIDLTDIRFAYGDPNAFIGKDSSGKDVKFRASDSDAQTLRSILNSDSWINFSGVTIDEDEIIKGAARKTAGDTVTVSRKPMCDVHGGTHEADYDARLPGMGGTWGNVCQRAFDQYGPGQTGTGHGHRFVVPGAAPVQGARFRGPDGR